jgi:hypothetical protein
MPPACSKAINRIEYYAKRPNSRPFRHTHTVIARRPLVSVAIQGPAQGLLLLECFGVSPLAMTESG